MALLVATFVAAVVGLVLGLVLANKRKVEVVEVEPVSGPDPSTGGIAADDGGVEAAASF